MRHRLVPLLLILPLSLLAFEAAAVVAGECAPAGTLIADGGTVTGSWSDPGVVDEFEFDCSGGPCTHTGAIPTWDCADPSFLYDGADTGYEFAYAFTAPGDGTCTFFEYDEGIQLGPGSDLSGVIDWFIVIPQVHGSTCSPGGCIGYVWENIEFDPLCAPARWCSYTEFAVQQGQEFFVVADIFDGLSQSGHAGYPYPASWTVEVQCDMTGGVPVPASGRLAPLLLGCLFAAVAAIAPLLGAVRAR